MRMPDITPESCVPTRDKFTVGRVFRTILLTGAALAAFGGGIAVTARLLTTGAGHLDSIYSLADTFGFAMFTDVQSEVLLSSVVGIIVIPIFVCIALAGINKSIRRAVDHVDQEWYG